MEKTVRNSTVSLCTVKKKSTKSPHKIFAAQISNINPVKSLSMTKSSLTICVRFMFVQQGITNEWFSLLWKYILIQPIVKSVLCKTWFHIVPCQPINSNCRCGPFFLRYKSHSGVSGHLWASSCSRTWRETQICGVCQSKQQTCIDRNTRHSHPWSNVVGGRGDGGCQNGTEDRWDGGWG